MPQYVEVKGQTIEFPDGMGATEIEAAIKKNMMSIGPDPTEGMSGTQKFLAGVGKGMTDVGRGVAQYLPEGLGGMSGADVAEARALDAPLMRTGAGMAGNVAGTLTAAVPAAFIPGANTLAGSAAIGSAYGLLQPGVDSNERIKNALIGGAFGAAVPAGITAFKTGKSMLEPLYQGGRETIVGRALAGAAGGQADDAIRGLRSATELVPGSAPTAAEAAGVPSLAALQRTATATNPSVANQMAARQAAQNEARIAALQGVTPDLQAAKAARESVAGTLYESARTAGIDPAKMTPEMTKRIGDLMGRLPDDVVESAKNLAKISGKPIDDAGSVQGLHWVKRAIDDKIGSAVSSGNGDMARAYSGLKDDFLGALDDLSPNYGKARAAYAEMSKPVNQSEVLGKIAEKSINFRGDITPAAFSRAASDVTAKSVTRMKGATLNSTLDAKQAKIIDAIKNDLARSDFANNAGRGVGSDTVQKLAYSNILDQAGVPTMLRNFGPAGIVGNVAQRAGQVVYKDANERLAAQLAESLLDPKATADLMQRGIITPETLKLISGAKRAGSYAGASLPGLLNAKEK
jgi:hypothetical protein